MTSGIPEDHFSVLVGNFFPKSVLTCQIDDTSSLRLSYIEAGIIKTAVKIPAFEVFGGAQSGL